LRHSPNSNPPYCLQIGDPATIATRCSFTTVAYYRSIELTAAGQAAPLLPPFHAEYFPHEQPGTVVVNILGFFRNLLAELDTRDLDPQDARATLVAVTAELKQDVRAEKALI
jgi:anhydro-N-acetylmuramic acid kinase